MYNLKAQISVVFFCASTENDRNPVMFNEAKLTLKSAQKASGLCIQLTAGHCFHAEKWTEPHQAG